MLQSASVIVTFQVTLLHIIIPYFPDTNLHTHKRTVTVISILMAGVVGGKKNDDYNGCVTLEGSGKIGEE